MKTKFFTLLAAIALISGLQFTRGAAVSVNVFYDNLEPYGDWTDTAEYGYIWHPRDVDENWRPYTVGNWAYTDAGWTWVSEEPFGWATYHYGRWVEIERVGWSWVPDREWGPAWVSWRRSDRHVGWAPLPPEARFESRVGIHEWSDSYYDIGPASYSFVSVRDFGAPRLRTVIVQPRENLTIINETRNITNITYVNNVIVNEGPKYDVIVRETAQPIRRLRIERRTDVDFRDGGERGRYAPEVRGDILRVAAPEVQISRDVAPKKFNQKLERVSVDRGWNKVGDAQTTERVRAKMASEARPPADLPPLSKLPGSERQAGRERDGAAPDGPARPGEVTTDGKPARDMKPGAQPPASPATTAEAPRPGAKEKPAAREEKDRNRTPGTATAPAERDPSRPETGVASEKPAREGERPEKGGKRPKPAAEENAPVAATPAERGNERPNAAARESMPKRPEARTNEETAPATEPPRTNEKPKKREVPDVENPARTEKPAREQGVSGERPMKERAPAERPDNVRPERAERPEKAERPERKAPPAAPAAEERGPSRPAPSAREERAPDRSPESRPPAPESRSPEASKKGGGEKAEKRGGDDKKDGKKDDKKDN